LLQKNLDETSTQVGSSNEAYNELKARVKVVAAELIERRTECRELKSQLEVEATEKEALQYKITSLEAQGMDKDISTTTTEQELNSLKGQLMDMEQKLDKSQKGIDQEQQKGEEALAAYKKKAQTSMSVANGRTASAIQAKEEAEMEARAARSTADSAMTRALVAEKNGNEALAEAKAYVKDMEAEVAKLNEIQATLDTVKLELEKAQGAATETKSANDKLECEMQTLSSKFEAEQNTTLLLQNELKTSQGRSHELVEELDRLRLQVQKAQTELKKVHAERKEAADSSNNNSNGYAAVQVVKPTIKADNSEAESTIMMLRQELEDANQAIKELKETLRSEVEKKEDLGGSSSTLNGDVVHNNNTGGQSNGGMPLFYAMEKQAELTQARNEIARLAGLLGDAQSSKQEALDAVEDFRVEMEQSRARARREQQLGGPSSETASKTNAKPQEKDSSLNIEYLKNVVLSYLNAKTVQEKKTLLPVIGTVLCLTADEQKKAIDALDQSGGVMDTISSSMLTSYWS
jgi:chromosome segregation ATPase